jgi:hypothetical protein
MVRLGIDGVTVSDRGFEPWRASTGHPVVYAWVCPSRLCGRSELAPAAPPTCAIIGRPLERVRLPT